jgi:hypothetical protein
MAHLPAVLVQGTGSSNKTRTILFVQCDTRTSTVQVTKKVHTRNTGYTYRYRYRYEVRTGTIMWPENSTVLRSIWDSLLYT